MNTVEKFCLWDVEFIIFPEERKSYLRRLNDLFAINDSIKKFVDVFGKQCKFRFYEKYGVSSKNCSFTLIYEQDNVVFKCDKFFIEYESEKYKTCCMLYIFIDDNLIYSIELSWLLTDLKSKLKSTWHTLKDRTIRLPFETYDEFIESTK